VFFKPIPSIQYIHNRKAHVFECAASQCRCRSRFVRRFLDKSDARSTSNLRRHARICWSDEAVEAADATRDVKTAHTALQNLKSTNGSITAAFQRVGEGKVLYSHRQHTKTEARYVILIYSSAKGSENYLAVQNLSVGSWKTTGHSRLLMTVAFEAL
jgi:hypothetical protein